MHYYLREKKISFLAILSLIIISVLGQKFLLIFQYDRASVINGEYWRIITCHFVHTSWEHLFLNLAGSVLVFSLFLRLYSLLVWLAGAICCMISISLSFLFFCPTLEWYMGLSGLLHGLIIMGVIGEIKKGNMLYYWGLLMIITKLAIEYFIGPANYINQFINAAVITPAHLSGAISGIIIACVFIFSQEILPNQKIRLKGKPAA